MKLKNYLEQQTVSVVNFSRLIHVGYNTVLNWVNCKKNPSKENVLKIKKATDNKVTEKDWVIENVKEKKGVKK